MSADRGRRTSDPPGPPADRPDDLLASVLDGRPVDWSVASSHATTNADRARLAALREVAGIVGFNRGLQGSGGSESAAEAAPAVPPETPRWGDLALIEPLGQGASGEVWRAWDQRLRREVALKFLQAGGAAAAPGAESPLLAEARALARLRHPGVVTVYGIAEHEGRVGMWMELLRGETLNAAIERGPLAQAEVARIGRELAQALAAVHEAGLVHRDVKPANVVIESGGRVVLGDFGLWGHSGIEEGETWDLSGTPMFMAPERLAGEPATPRSDLYALGVTLRWALTGRPPFTARTLAELKAEVARGPAAALRDERPHASASLIAAIERAMSPAPRRRFASGTDLARAIAGDLREGGAARHSLSAEADSFVGREADLERLEGSLEIESRLVTLVGAAGMGKTRLAVRYGWQSLGRWPGGVWFCDLTEARSLEGIAAAVAGSLAVPPGKEDPVAQLGHAIAGRGRCLVILDNFEQVSELAGTTVVPWLERAPEARFLATSRERLGVSGENAHAVEPLASDSGAELFLERARRREPEFAPRGSEADAVREVVTLSEGIPLVIELAAARIRMMTVVEIARRMREQMLELGEAGSGRHARLQAAIDGSWELLRDWEKSAWAQCAVFEGGFTLEAAARVLDLARWPEAPWVVDVVQSLVDKSLLRTWLVATEPRGIAPESRLGMYASLHEHARLKLQDRGEIDAVEARHGAWYARYGTNAAIQALGRHGGVQQRRRLERELDNLMAACRRAVARGGGSVAAGTYRAAWAVLESRGPYSASVELGREGLRDCLFTREEEASVLITLGAAEWRIGAADGARAHLEAALAMARDLGDRHLECRALSEHGAANMTQGHLEEAGVHLERTIGLAREIGDRRLECSALNNLSVLRRDQGRMQEAEAGWLAAVEIARRDGNRLMEGTMLGNLGLLYQDRGRAEEARGHYEGALAIHREVGNRNFEASIVGNLGSLYGDQGRLEEARVHLEAALVLCREVGNRRSEGITLANLANAVAAQGLRDQALAYFEEALAIQRELGNRRLEGGVLGYLGKLHQDRDEIEAARADYEAALEIHRKEGDPRYEGAVLGRLASLLHRQGNLEAARDALATGEPLLRQVGAGLELAQLLCVRAEFDHRGGNAAAARAALAEAEELAAQLGAGPDSDLGRDLASARRTLAG